MKLFKSLFVLAILACFITSCTTDNCTNTIKYMANVPVYKTKAEIIDVKSMPAMPLEKTGKIYVQGNYLFINELETGIHIIDNTNPKSPQNIAFIKVPGNVDMAVRNNIMYADNYTDLIALDITNPNAVKIGNRVENAFASYGTSSKGILVGSKWEEITEVKEGNCNTGVFTSRYYSSNGMLLGNSGDITNFFSGNPTASNSSAPQVSKGGSMARFALYQNYLYTVNSYSLQLFNIANPLQPQKANKVFIGQDIETIFPYQDKLFIGSQTGMYIYDNSNPALPKQLSVFQHARACDPVVVEGTTAYVTLRSGTSCVNTKNQLDVIDIANITAPKLIKSYAMQNPHGVGIDNNVLFVCDGKFGLKVFDATSKTNIDKNMLANFANVSAYDVIPMGNVLLMIGENGLYQYDYSDTKSIKLLSVIPVIKK
jgi:hypothetical protein